MFRSLLFLLLICLFLFNQSFAQENTVIAIIDDKPVTQADVDFLVAGKINPLREQINAIRKIALENYITNLLLEKEAKQRGMSIQEFKESLTNVKVTVTPEEIESTYLENRETFGLMNPEEAKERIRLDLINYAKMRAYRTAIEQLRNNAKIVYFNKPFALKVKTDYEGPTIGNKDAKISIVEFSDFMCPHCKRSQNVLKQILKKYGNEIRIIFKHLPLQPNSQILSRAAACADKQERFREYHDQLFEIETLSEEVPVELAKKLKLDVADFQKCMTANESLSVVLRDQNEAKRLGIDSTPSFIINGEIIRGVPDLQTFIQLIESQKTPQQETLSTKTGGQNQ